MPPPPMRIRPHTEHDVLFAGNPGCHTSTTIYRGFWNNPCFLVEEMLWEPFCFSQRFSCPAVLIHLPICIGPPSPQAGTASVTWTLPDRGKGSVALIRDRLPLTGRQGTLQACRSVLDSRSCPKTNESSMPLKLQFRA